MSQAADDQPRSGFTATVGDPGAAAFFDVDNTLVAGASIFHFAKGMAARGLFSWRDLARFATRQARLRVKGETPEDMASARESALAFVADKPVAEIVALGEEIYDDEISKRLWTGTVNLAQRHLADGQQVWLVTATPIELAEIISRRLGLTGALGTVAETADGRYTGRLVGETLHGQAKADAVLALADRANLDLSRCSAYSDSINDMPLLSLVGHPVAVNPDSALRGEARQHGWDIRDFRRGRSAAKYGLTGAVGAGAIASGISAGVIARRQRERRRQEAMRAHRRLAARLPTGWGRH